MHKDVNGLELGTGKSYNGIERLNNDEIIIDDNFFLIFLIKLMISYKNKKKTISL